MAAYTFVNVFNGIVEQTTRVIAVVQGPGFNRVTLAMKGDDLRDGESVAVNGVCLTVAERTSQSAGFDVITETLSRTNLGQLAAGDAVHIERSMRVGDRIDGHFVQGHVEGTATLLSQRADENENRLTLECPDHLLPFLTPKGSVTLDGVSLTIASIDGHEFDVALIPTTLRMTLLGQRPLGWRYNVETDVLARTVVTHLERQRGSAEDKS